MSKRLLLLLATALLITFSAGCTAAGMMSTEQMQKTMVEAMRNPAIQKSMTDSMMRSPEGRQAMAVLMKSKEMQDAMAEIHEDFNHTGMSNVSGTQGIQKTP